VIGCGVDGLLLLRHSRMRLSQSEDGDKALIENSDCKSGAPHSSSKEQLGHGEERGIPTNMRPCPGGYHIMTSFAKLSVRRVQMRG
jgi:hypothetical protein